MQTWSLQDAKVRFSEVVNKARAEGPQMVSRRGEEAVVILSVEEYRGLKKKKAPKQSLVDFLRNSPLKDLDEKLLARSPDPGRIIKL